MGEEREKRWQRDRWRWIEANGVREVGERVKG